ncbi:transposase IS66 [Caballeronia temeraria]|uniref:Transposase IS66 n=1 Tax=Caballeronia temeraria TaxID=1777137 RepID=A0A158AHK5_9BURK|nr:transposase IS66 [Caballeronia temeraria]
MWCYRSAQDCAEPVVLFEYQPGRGQEHPQKFLGDYSGMLMSDGYSAWRTLKKAAHFGCMAQYPEFRFMSSGGWPRAYTRA